MGRSTTPTFRIDYTCAGTHMTSTAWGPSQRKHVGRANEANLKVEVDGFLASCEPGGVNDHLKVIILEARLVHQPTGTVRATYKPQG
jgi:hypothetical protein